MNGLLHQVPLGSDYPLQPEQECSIDQTGFVSEALRDGPAGLLASSTNGGVRCMPRRPTAHDPTYSDSGSGSISTSPSSNASSLAFSTSGYSGAAVYGQGHSIQNITNPYPTASQVFPAHYSVVQPFSGMTTARPRLASITDSSASILPSSRSPGLPVSPTSSARENYTTSTPGISRHLISPRSTYDPLRSSYNYPETPRSMMSSASILSSPGYAHPVGLGVDRRGTETPPFLEQDTLHELVCNGQTIAANIEAKIEKGFFMSSDNSWTCYRRNYFAVQCSFTLTPFPAGRQIYLAKTGEKRQLPVQAMAVSLSAAVDGATGKTIELVQHTPKRDKGPQSTVGIVKLVPTPPGNKYPHGHPTLPHGYPLDTFGQASQAQASPTPYLPLQDQLDSSPSASAQDEQAGYPNSINSPTAHQYTFERIQFKSATANNGKRRAQQQYYHLIVELYVDIRAVDDREPKWVKIAQRPSHAVVVRGRSPSHYSNEGPHSARSSGGASGGGSGLGFGGMMRTTPGAPLGDAAGYRISMSHPTYRGSTYSLDPSSASLEYHSSSVTALPAPTIDSIADSKPIISSGSHNDSYKPLDHVDAYQYYPSPLFDAGLPHPAKSDNSGQTYDPTGRVKDEVSPAFPPGGVSSAWPGGRCRQFQGVSSSRGYYPSVDTGY